MDIMGLLLESGNKIKVTIKLLTKTNSMNAETAATKYLRIYAKGQTRRFQPTRRGEGYETFLFSANIKCAI